MEKPLLLFGCLLLGISWSATGQPPTARKYELVPGSFTWLEAKADAERKGGHLAAITSQQEFDAIRTAVPELLAAPLWIGLYREDNDPQWKWVTGEPYSFTTWAPGQPEGGAGLGDVAGLSPSATWNDTYRSFNDRAGYLIEYEGPQPETTVTLVSLTDHTFEDGTWVSATAFDSTPPGTSSGSARQVATGGNPGSYRSATLAFGRGIFAVRHLSTLAVIDPRTQGAIRSIDFSYDFIKLAPLGFGAINYMLAVLQNGVLYVVSREAPGDESWTTYKHSALVAADFVSIEPNAFFGGTEHPDFSNTAPPLQFGYVTLHSNPGAPATTTSGIDNWTVQLSVVSPIACVPHRATAVATVINGFVVGIEVTAPGCGYTEPPLVEISGNGSGATATAVVSNGFVSDIVVNSAGAGYTTPPTIRIASPPFTPWLEVSVSKVNVRQHLVLGKRYQLESSDDLKTWSDVGGVFTAADEEVTQELDVISFGRYFRVRQVP